MAGPSQFGGAADLAGADLAAQVQALGTGLAALQQQLAQLSAAYEAMLQSLGGATGGIG
jgi:hypothetical protein